MSQEAKHGSSMTPDRRAWRFFSPSTLTQGDHGTSEGCARKVYYSKRLQLKGPEKKWQTDGKELHAQNEYYLKTGDRSGMGPLAQAGIHMLPQPFSVDKRILIEHDITGPSLDVAPLRPGGVPMVGYIDCIHWRGTNAGGMDVLDTLDPEGTVEVIDWKTTSDPKWIKSPQEVARTVQMTTYGKWAVEVKKAEWVRLSHGYYVTKGRHAPRKVSLKVHRDQINERWEYVEQVAGSLVEAVKHDNVDDVPANTKACQAFKGCEHLAYCKAASHNSLTEYIGEDFAASLLGIAPPPVITFPEQATQGSSLMSLLDKLKNAAPKTDAQKPSKEEEMQRLLTEELNAKYPGAIEAVLKLEALGLGMPNLAGEAARVYLVANKMSVSGTPTEPLKGSGELEGFTFSDANQIKDVLAEAEVIAAERGTVDASPATGESAVEEASVVDPFPADAPAALAAPAEKPAPAPASEAEPEIVDAAAAMAAAASDEKPKGKKRGPKPKAVKAAEEALAKPPAAEIVVVKGVIADPPVITPEIVQALADEGAAAAKEYRQRTAGMVTGCQPPDNLTKPRFEPITDGISSKEINLFIECIPNRAYKSFWPIINRVTDGIAKKFGAMDYRACGNDTEAGFGKWKAFVAHGLKTLYAAGEIPAGDYLLDNSMNETAGVAIEAMRDIVAQSGGLLVKGIR